MFSQWTDHCNLMQCAGMQSAVSQHDMPSPDACQHCVCAPCALLMHQAEAALGEYGQLGEDFEGVVQQYATTKVQNGCFYIFNILHMCLCCPESSCQPAVATRLISGCMVSHAVCW